ncbi:hypothetical protein Patl1_09857 [Pistacia atlantica]|uniref:Uncharacterized protein n=1 Tax=Pistacia atlantica TaxID=434234 RepID=A0ACC1A0W8_9ROSI|nr:hypothetical protein Patl1_09857 [Pistacia atlantica]
MTTDGVLAKNEYEDTALHEAPATRNLEVVKLLVEYELPVAGKNTDFLEDINDKGEAPMFKAAAYGRTKVRKSRIYKAKRHPRPKNNRIKAKPEPFKPPTPLEEKTIELQGGSIILHVASEPSKPPTHLEEKTSEVPRASIQHAAIQGEHFGLFLCPALLLLNLDKSLATLKDEIGRTSLHLLATMSSAFNSGY